MKHHLGSISSSRCLFPNHIRPGIPKSTTWRLVITNVAIFLICQSVESAQIKSIYTIDILDYVFMFMFCIEDLIRCAAYFTEFQASTNLKTETLFQILSPAFNVSSIFLCELHQCFKQHVAMWTVDTLFWMQPWAIVKVLITLTSPSSDGVRFVY